MPTKHPDRRHVAAKCLIAGDILNGSIRDPYDDREADLAARLIVATDDH